MTRTNIIFASIVGMLAILVFLVNIAYIQSAYEMAAFSATFLSGMFMILLLLLKPFEGILIYCVLSPILQMFNNVVIAVPGSSATFSFGGVILTLILVFGGLACFRPSGEKHFPAKDIISIFLIFSGWMLICSIVNGASIDLLRSLKEFGRILGSLVIFVIGLKYCKSVKDANKFLVALFTSLVVPVCFAVWQIVIGTKYVELEQFNRVMGTFGIPNMFGMYLILPLILFVILSVGGYLKETKLIAAWFSLIMLILVMFFTYTRASWLALLFGIMYVAFRKYRILIPLTIIPILLMIGFFSFEGLRLGSTGSSGRIGLWTILAPAGLSSPFFGKGLMSMSMITKGILGFSNQGQNQYLLYWLEGGVLGVTFFVLLLIRMYQRIKNIYRKLGEGLYKEMHLGFIAAFLGNCLIAFFESNAIFQIWVWLPAGVFIGAGTRVANEPQKNIC